MKKAILMIIGILSMTSVFAQDITDALRYSQDEIQGTARYRSLSGAFGALGGDMSAVSINPAGSVIFNSSHISLSLSNSNSIIDINYFNGFNSSSNSIIDINQVGATFVFQNRNTESKWKKFTFSVAYDKIQDFDEHWFISGTNTNNSIDSYFLAHSNGLRLDEISAFVGESFSDAYAEIGSSFGFENQQAFLGYESFILEPETFDDDNTIYSSNVANGSYHQEYNYASTGYNGKFTINAGTQYGDKLYFGINLNSHFINYERNTYLFENNDNIDAAILSPIKEIEFENSLLTVGTGFSFQFGTILKLTKQFRIGLTYNSPTWLTIEEETSQFISTLRDDAGILVTQTINPDIINIFPSYRLQTPGKITGSLAYIFGNRGLISLDYSLKDYSNTKFKPTSDAYFSNQNTIISNMLTTASTLKIGGELKHKQLSFRGGYRLEESPYKNETTIGDLTGYSLGLGYNFGKLLKLDLTFDQAKRKNQQQLYTVGLTDAANIDETDSNITLTASFSL